jgi:lipid-A-disaccharide synthase
MLVAGDPSGDALAADLMLELDEALDQPARFIGAGGPRMAATGAALAFDLTQSAVIGLVFKKLPFFWRRAQELVRLARQEKPDVIVLVDFSWFNLWLGAALKRALPADARPKIVKYVSSQVWAYFPWRANLTARHADLLLCLYPFEKGWYARRTPGLRVECVGHPMFDKYGPIVPRPVGNDNAVALLPGSRRGELLRHLPVIADAARQIAARLPAQFKMVLPSDEMAALARTLLPPDTPPIEFVTGQLEPVLRWASLAIASTGTVTLECAYFGVPTVALYKTSWSTYLVGRLIVGVKYLAMPNILSDEPLLPEFIQGHATAANIAEAALSLLDNPDRRRRIQERLGQTMAEMGGPGAGRRAAQAIAALLSSQKKAF